ncbi:MAG: Tol-Pal system beta propeller repeat protein TolB [Thermoanaerobaculia bacterium]
MSSTVVLRCLPAAVTVLVAGVGWVAAQGQPPAPEPPAGSEITIQITGEARSVVVLSYPVPDASAAGSLSTAAREADATLRDDLEASRIFRLLGPQELAVLALTGDPARDFELHRSLGGQILLDVAFTTEEGNLVLEGRLYDLKSGEPILGKRYRGEATAARRIAHTFADEIVQYFAGRRGISSTSLAFVSDRGGSRPNEIKEVFLMDYDGRNQRPVTAHKTISLSPSFSPSSDAVAYTSYFSGRPGLYLVLLPGGSKRAVITDGSLNANPSFSPDGTRIAFTRSLGDGNSEIFVCNRDGSGLRQLTHANGIDTNAAWSPGGREIAFTSSRSGEPQLYTMDAEGANLRRISLQGEYNDGAEWSPDGTRLTYASRTGSNRFDILLADLVTLEATRLTSGPASNESPTFSPDGQRIAFARTLGGGAGRTQIFAMDIDGGHPRQLTSDGNNWAPSWSGFPPR